MVTLNALIALSALFFTSAGSLLVPPLVFALVTSHTTRVRLPSGTGLLWPLRLLAYVVIVVVNANRSGGGTDWLFDPRTVSIAGEILALEMVLQSWRAERNDGLTVFLASMVFLAACNTFDDRFIRLFTPLYVLTTLAALHGLRPRGAVAEQGSARFALRRWTACGAAVAVGASLHFAIWAHRAELTIWGSRILATAPGLQRSGLSTRPTLTSTVEVPDSPERVLRLIGYHGDGHLRGLAFDTYDHGRWGPALEQRHGVPVNGRLLHAAAHGPRAEFERLLDNSGVLLLPLEASGVDAPDADSASEEVTYDPDHGGPLLSQEPAPYGYGVVLPGGPGGAGILPALGGGVAGVGNARLGVPVSVPTTPQENGIGPAPRQGRWSRYAGTPRRAFPTPATPPAQSGQDARAPRVGAGAPSHAPLWSASPDLEELRRCLQVPNEIDPRVCALAAKAAAGYEDPKARIEAVQDYLITHHHYSHTTQVGAGDPVSSFLLQRKDAHCEFFASAAVILLRCLRIPARYVSGYFAHESAGGDEMVVRQRDAHAWAEAWVAGRGWVTVDATPADGRPDELSSGTPFWRRGWEWLQDRLNDARRWAGRKHSTAELVRLGEQAGAVLVGYLALSWLWSQRRRRGRPTEPPYSGGGPELQRLARRFERLLARRGAACPPQRTYLQHAALLQDGAARLEPAALREFTALYTAARFGGEADAATLARLRGTLHRLQRRRRPPGG